MDEERNWLMLAAAALAGGKPARDAVAAADQVVAAHRSRFPESPE